MSPVPAGTVRRKTESWIGAGLVLLAAVSFFLIGDWATDMARHGTAIASLEEKTDTVLKLSGAAALPGGANNLDTDLPHAARRASLCAEWLEELGI